MGFSRVSISESNDPLRKLPMSPIDRPFDEILSECTTLIERMNVTLGDIEPLSPAEVRRRYLGRKNPAIVEAIATHCAEFGITNAGGITTDDITTSLERARDIRRVVDRLDLVRARLETSRMQSESRGWRTALLFYAVLRGLSLDDASLKSRVESVRALFQPRARARTASTPRPAGSRRAQLS